MSTDEAPSLIREFSFGGVVVRGRDVLVIVPRGKTVLALPKGGADAGERGEDAAVREVREETGIEARALELLGDVRYWYRRRGLRVLKTVRFWLCEYVGGEPVPQPVEVSEARWIPLAEAPRALAYTGEREVVERARSKLSANG